MNNSIKQAIYIIACSIIIGFLTNSLRPNGIPLLAKQINFYSDNTQFDEFIIEFIDLSIAKQFFQDNVPFIDARDEDSFNKGHISRAITSVSFEEMVNELFNIYGFNAPLVVYCDDDECGLSEDLAYRLQAEGFSKIYVFSGGWDQWLNAGLPVNK